MLEKLRKEKKWGAVRLKTARSSSRNTAAHQSPNLARSLPPMPAAMRLPFRSDGGSGRPGGRSPDKSGSS